MDKMIEVRYAGAVVGRTAIVRELDTRGLFLGITEPLPVGTTITLKIGDASVEGKVFSVAESQEMARAGMRVRFLDPSAAALFGTPGEAAPEAEPPPAPKAPVAPVEEAAPASASAPGAGGPRRIVVDASTETAVPEPSTTGEASTAADAGDATGAVSAAPEPGKPADQKKNRKNKRR